MTTGQKQVYKANMWAGNGGTFHRTFQNLDRVCSHYSQMRYSEGLWSQLSSLVQALGSELHTEFTRFFQNLSLFN